KNDLRKLLGAVDNAEAWVGSPKAARWRRFDHGRTVG
nr:hypothetical protein [Tanacetum cinerariifolium]